MFHVIRIKGLLILFSLFMMGFSCGGSAMLFSFAELEKADTGWKAPYLSMEERKLVKLINLARMDGRRFFDSYILEYVEQNSRIDTTSQYFLSLKEDLYRVNGLPLFEPDRKLYEAAKFHAVDMGKSGKTGHNSADGTNFIERFRRFTGSDYDGIAENCGYGNSKALAIAVQLLIDDGVVSLGHRKNILDADSRYIGVAIRPHKGYGYNCVMDFSRTANTPRN